MEEGTQFLIRHGGQVVFWVIFAEQLGLPVPGIPVLVAAGALAGTGKMNPAAAVGLPVLASLVADYLWFYLGRSRGGSVLSWLCRISLEPDSCVRRTGNLFQRHGARSLLIAKFVPGLSTVTPPLAGMFGMSASRFLLYDGTGAFLWVGTSVGLGYAFSSQLEQIARLLAGTGTLLVVVLVGALAGFIGYKYLQRQRFLRALRMSRITVDELKSKIDSGEDLAIVDLRHPLDIEANPHVIPGARHLLMEELEHRHHEIPRDRDIVLYCGCPNEVTSARTVLLLKKNGIQRVRPLAGGIEAWRARNFPVEVRPPVPTSPANLPP
jgi:membrane protein DedA with SNARE-associated domain/rhodanese-related sulfurtransferase